MIDRAALILGYAGVYSSFLLHAERAAQAVRRRRREILLELGRRKMVGGQEDMIIDVAAELAGRREGETAHEAPDATPDAAALAERLADAAERAADPDAHRQQPTSTSHRLPRPARRHRPAGRRGER